MAYPAPIPVLLQAPALCLAKGRPSFDQGIDRAWDVLRDPAFPYGENLLQFIWEAQLFDRHALRTTDGLPVDVIRPGRLHSNTGPDLQEAQLRIAGQLWAGSVEVHVRSSEWNAHHHQSDPAYDGVVLHVVFEHDADVRTLSGRVLPTVELMSRINTDSLALFAELMRSRAVVPCAGLLSSVDPTRLNTWLESVLIERLIRKTEQAEMLFSQLGDDGPATFYHLLARAFGLGVNAEPFGMLAHALPWKLLLRHRDQQLRIEALLFGQAGLLRTDFVDAYPVLLRREHAALTFAHDLRPTPLAAWKFGRMRPMNFPTVRIAQFAALIGRLDGDVLTLLDHDSLAPLRARLEAEPSSYWLSHYLFDRPSSERAKRLGSSAADHLIINAVVPMLFLMARVKGSQALRDRAVRLLEQMPAERNSITEGWAALGLEADSAARGQALIELRNGYCTPRKCLLCGIGRHLMRSVRPFDPEIHFPPR
ncbi:MAG: DUF2851 family protein [Flavobacteriales bacterium]|nr:DUF2851 family protein [Flavobacteriales bacterium]MBP6697516.1 DUF2851 family protein [Flavobacteriales bacterium]